MDRVRVLGWLGVAISLWIVLRSDMGSAAQVLALLALAVASRVAVDSLALFVAATAVWAAVRSDLASEVVVQALYLPLYVMFAVIYLLVWLSLRVPELARRTGAGRDVGGRGGKGGDGC